MTAPRPLLEAGGDGTTSTSGFKLLPVPRSRRRGRRGWNYSNDEGVREQDMTSTHRRSVSSPILTVEEKKNEEHPQFNCIISKVEEDEGSDIETPRPKSFFHHSNTSLEEADKDEAEDAEQEHHHVFEVERWGVGGARNVVVYDKVNVAPSINLESATEASMDSIASSLRSSGLGAQRRRLKSIEIPILLSPCAPSGGDSTPRGPSSPWCDNTFPRLATPLSDAENGIGHNVWRNSRRPSSSDSLSTMRSSSSTDSTSDSSVVGTPPAETRTVMLRSEAGDHRSKLMPRDYRDDSLNAVSSAQFHGHTIVHLAPMSPLTPGRAAEQHTPKERQFGETPLHLDSLPASAARHLSSASEPCSVDSEPLSATLRRLGAARDSADHQEKDDEASRPPWILKEEWAERIAAQRELRHEAEIVAERNRSALEKANGLTWKHTTTAPQETVSSLGLRIFKGRSEHGSTIESTVRGGRLGATAKRISRGLASFLWRQDAHPPHFSKSQSSSPAFETLEIPAPDQATCKRTVRGDGWGGRRPSSSWFPGLTTGPLISPTNTVVTNHKKENDEYGPKGLRILQLGSVASSTTLSFHQSTLARGHSTSRSMSLLHESEITSPRMRRGHASALEDAQWEDEKEETANAEDELKLLHKLGLHVAEHGSEKEAMQPLRVRFPSTLPQPRKDLLQDRERVSDPAAVKSFTNSAPLRFKELLSVSSTKLRDKISKKRDADEACVVTYTDKCAEGRPLKLKRWDLDDNYGDDGKANKNGWLRTSFRWIFMTVLIVTILTVILVAATNALNKQHPKEHHVESPKNVTVASPTPSAPQSAPVAPAASSSASQIVQNTTVASPSSTSADGSVQSAVSDTYPSPAARVPTSEEPSRSAEDETQTENEGVAKQVPILEQQTDQIDRVS
ncbi:hypothetical protein FA10DRAFT_298981 [Acaromyces ingoldii]|uniref:Uncharacterized protein n=1 Tax=Acaromyces ingoldii TaxID=215250 RepID=A0A316YWW3_9BASI|nr:hypothetical protein FA10DRAFT_298981 [Acaromyces ingoldii]PWN93612.1 hypothetical protein FA10DRAFT_298981 [Acaromyces ingoldii]